MQKDRVIAKAERRMHQARASKSVFIFVLLANAIAGCGLLPTHLHDPGRLKVAEGIRDEMAQYSANAPSMYAAMLENLERFKVEEDWLLGELAANSDTAFITAIPNMTGKALKKDLERLKTEIGNLQTRIYEDVKTDADDAEKRKAALNKAKQAVKDAKKEVKDAKELVKRWNAQVALFQELIGRIPGLKSSLTADQASFDDVFAEFKKLADIKVTFKDADGKDDTAKISDLLGFLKGNKDKELPAALTSLADAPGLSVELASVGLELAKVQQKRAAAELEYIEQRATLMEDTLIVSELASLLVGESEKSALLSKQNLIKFVAIKRAYAPDVWKKIISKDSQDPEKDEKDIETGADELQVSINAVHHVLVGLRYHAVARSMLRRQSAVYKLELKRLKHQRSILRSKLADEAWQALVGTGLESLVAFHRGGWKLAHLANFLRLAQAAALVAIAD